MILETVSRFDLNKTDSPVKNGDDVIGDLPSSFQSQLSGREVDSRDKETSGEDILKR
ncbi:hypothetical protein Hanom_Chr03g00262501 [Helianthus anomalus]